jgi:hypothetical protein
VLQSRARPRSRWPLILCALAIFIGAFGLRWQQAHYRLPYVHNADEHRVGNQALRMLKTADYRPSDYYYGSLLIYADVVVDVLHYLNLRAKPDGAPALVRNVEDIQTGLDTGWRWDISHPTFFLWNRGLAALAGLGCVMLTFFLARALAGEWPAILAALLMSGVQVHIDYSALITTDVPAAFLALASTYMAFLYARNERASDFVLALILGGLATSTKYNAALALIASAAALLCVTLRGNVRPWLWLATPVLPVLAFVAGSPYALAELPNFLHFVGWETRHYMSVGQVGRTVEPGWPQLSLQLGQMASNLGWFAAGIAVLGLWPLLRKPQAWVAFSFPLLYLAFTARTRIDFHHNYLVLYPFACVAFAGGVAWLWAGIAARLVELRTQRIARLALVALLALALGVHTIQAVAHAHRSYATLETRSQAIAELERLATEQAWTRVGLAQELRIHAYDLRRLHGLAYEVLPSAELFERRAEFDAIVAAREYDTQALRAESLKQNMEALNRARPKSPILFEITGNDSVHLTYPSRDPGVVIVGRE